MGAYTVAEVKTHLSAILEAMAGGEEVVVTKRGKAVARIRPEKQNPMATDWARIDAFRDTLKASKVRPHACNWNRRCFQMSPSSMVTPTDFRLAEIMLREFVTSDRKLCKVAAALGLPVTRI